MGALVRDRTDRFNLTNWIRIYDAFFLLSVCVCVCVTRATRCNKKIKRGEPFWGLHFFFLFSKVYGGRHAAVRTCGTVCVYIHIYCCIYMYIYSILYFMKWIQVDEEKEKTVRDSLFDGERSYRPPGAKKKKVFIFYFFTFSKDPFNLIPRIESPAFLLLLINS
jgi:hypothetical protein